MSTSKGIVGSSSMTTKDGCVIQVLVNIPRIVEVEADPIEVHRNRSADALRHSLTDRRDAKLLKDRQTDRCDVAPCIYQASSCDGRRSRAAQPQRNQHRHLKIDE